MELRNCEYCGTAYDARLSQCPLCGRTAGGQKAPAQPEPKRVRPAAENKPEKIQPTQPDTPARTEKAPAGKRLRQEPGGARAARGYTGKRLRTGAAAQVQDGSDTPEAPKGGNVYAIPKWMMATICVILGLAVLGGALLAFSRLGWSPLYRETTLEAPAQTADTQPETTQPEPAQSAQPAEAASDPAADENRYRNEEDQKPVQTEETSQQPESAACTSLTLSAPTVTFEDAGRFFNITFTRKPAECTEPVTFTSSDENVATVSEQGKIVAVNAGSAVITAACGVGLRVDDLGPETLEHLAVHLTGGLGDDVRHAQLCDEHRRQDADVDLFTDADRDRAAVLHAGLLQRGLVQLVDDKRIVGVAPPPPATKSAPSAVNAGFLRPARRRQCFQGQDFTTSPSSPPPAASRRPSAS